ncbi:MAG: hypothetical protein Q8P38_06135, partial [Candidatus Nanopelagicales bacterium]|nr:hypothetical protein [Candidatus Nanopelagicales bacterium]
MGEVREGLWAWSQDLGLRRSDVAVLGHGPYVARDPVHSLSTGAGLSFVVHSLRGVPLIVGPLWEHVCEYRFPLRSGEGVG